MVVQRYFFAICNPEKEHSDEALSAGISFIRTQTLDKTSHWEEEGSCESDLINEALN